MLRTTLATAFLASTIPFIASNNLTRGQENPNGPKSIETKDVKEKQLRTQGFLIDFQDEPSF